MKGETAVIQERGNWKLRAFDRYAGIPLVVVLGMTHRKARRPPEHVRSIALLMTTAIGDAILNSAAVDGLRRRHPEARIKAFCSSGNLAIARMIAGIDEVVPVPV